MADADLFGGGIGSSGGYGRPAAGLDLFPSYQGSIAPPSSGGARHFIHSHATALSLALLVIAIAVAAILVMIARRKRASGPYSAGIEKIENQERRDDMKEYQYLWRLARRPSVKSMLNDVLAANVNSPGSAVPSSAMQRSEPIAPAIGETGSKDVVMDMGGGHFATIVGEGDE